MNTYEYDRYYGDIITQPYENDDELYSILENNDIEYFVISNGDIYAYINGDEEEPLKVSGLTEDDLLDRIREAM